jgi:hypothetical protein
MTYSLGFDNMTYAPGTAGTPEGDTSKAVSSALPVDSVIDATQPDLNSTQATGKTAETSSGFPWWLLIGAGVAWYL